MLEIAWELWRCKASRVWSSQRAPRGRSAPRVHQQVHAARSGSAYGVAPSSKKSCEAKTLEHTAHTTLNGHPHSAAPHRIAHVGHPGVPRPPALIVVSGARGPAAGGLARSGPSAVTLLRRRAAVLHNAPALAERRLVAGVDAHHVCTCAPSNTNKDAISFGRCGKALQVTETVLLVAWRGT